MERKKEEEGNRRKIVTLNNRMIGVSKDKKSKFCLWTLFYRKRTEELNKQYITLDNSGILFYTVC